MRRFGLAAIILCILLAGMGVQWVRAQQGHGLGSGMLTPLVKMDLTDVPNKQVIANIYDVPSGAVVPRHFHHGDEFHFVLSGEWIAEVQGKPDHLMKAGDSQLVERELWHGGKVVSTTPLKLLGVMIVDKDKSVVEIVEMTK